MEKVVDLNCWHKDHVKNKQELEQLYQKVQALYHNDPYPDHAQRIALLTRLKAQLLARQDDLVEALKNDYGFRSEFDSLISDLLPAVNHINYTIKHVKKWMKPSRRHAGLLLSPSKVKVEYQPVGVVGVIVPWNFPIFLSLGPVVTALAAGNRVMVKLSEYTPHTNQVLSEICASLEDHIFAIEGEADIAESFSSLPFDHLIFTGSTSVGRLVAQAAAKNLTPVTLELGGKSPVIIGDDADIKRAVDAIMIGKSINAGQICVAPDYILLPEGKEQLFIHTYLAKYKKRFVRKGQLVPITQIVNERQYQRLQTYLSDAKQQGATIHTLEDVQLNERQMLPNLITGVTHSMLLMKEEIFGPILPIITYRQLSDAFTIVNQRPRPLALYLMSDNQVLQKQVVEQTHSGGVVINDTLLHVAADDAPFGGIGESGIGHYHGKEGFYTFSHAKTVMVSPSWLPRSHLLLKYPKLLVKLLSSLFLR